MDARENTAILVADLGYGDAGKGSIIDCLARTRPVHTVIRYNGGAQAAHNVITPDGRHHTFAQFSSGTFIPGVRTHLSRFMLLHPLAMLAEERHLRSLGVADAFARTSIDRGALVITPFQQAANRLKELARGDGRHGSCGMGVGETQSDWLALGADVLFAGDLDDRAAVRRKLRFLQDTKLAQLRSALDGLPRTPAVLEELRVFQDPELIEATADLYAYLAGQIHLVPGEYLGGLLRQPGTAVFEGAQGVLLDEWWGFYPYNSWSMLTFQNADRLLAENGFGGETIRLGLIRAYATRHGAGPFVSEDARLTAEIWDAHNANNPWQRAFRVGYLDFLALRYSLWVTGGVDGLVVSHLDRLEEIPDWQVCAAYRYPGKDPVVEDFFEIQDGLVREIKISADPTDLARQERLTRFLMEMVPVCSPVEREQRLYIKRIERDLGLPILLTSSGPTAKDKWVPDPLAVKIGDFIPDAWIV